MDGVIILQIILILVIIGVIVYLLRLYHVTKLEKRIAPFAIQSTTYTEKSLFDQLFDFFWTFLQKISKILKKSVFLTKYSERYNKYIAYDDKEKIEGIDFLSMKLILTMFVLLLSLLTMIFHPLKIDFIYIFTILVICFFIPDIGLKIQYTKKRKKVEEDLLKAIIIMNNAFQSGKNIMQATNIVKTQLDGPIQDEFKKIYLDITYGLSLDVVFERFYERIKLEDAKYITSSLSLLNKTGGDIIGVFSMIEKSIIDRKNMRNELHSLTASSRFVFHFLVFLPILFVLFILILNPSYFTPFFTSFLGIMIFLIILSLYVLYILIIRKLLRIEL